MGDNAVPPMQVGFNYPVAFNRDGHNFGPFPHVDPKDTSQENPLWIKTLPPNLQALKKMGVTVVRWFIMGNCFNYGPAPTATSQGGFGISKLVWHFDQPDFLDDPNYRGDPDGKVRRFVDHFPLMLAEFKKSGLQVIPSLIDFHAFLDPLSGEVFPLNAKLRARARGDIVEDPPKRRKFLERVLKKLLDLSQPFKDSIFAWEVVNEPIWNINSLKPVDPMLGNRIIPRSVMKEFLEQACTIIEDAGFPSTVGHRFFEDCLNLPTGTIAQYHYYPHTATLSIPGVVSIPIATLVINDDPKVIPDYNSALSQIRDAQRTVRAKIQER